MIKNLFDVLAMAAGSASDMVQCVDESRMYSRIAEAQVSA